MSPGEYQFEGERGPGFSPRGAQDQERAERQKQEIKSMAAAEEHEHELVFYGYENDDDSGWEVWVCSYPGCLYEEDLP